MTLRSHILMAAAVVLMPFARAEDQAAVVVDRDGRVKSLLVEPGPVTLGEIKDSFHEVEETDPDFVPPPPAILEPAMVAEPAETQAQSSVNNILPPPNQAAEVAQVSAPPAAVEVRPAVVPEPPPPLPLFEPNQNGVIVLPGSSRASSGEGIANPFDIRLLGLRAVHEVKIRVGGVVMGDRPTAMVNSRPCSANDRWNGFNVVAIKRDAVLLERDGVFLLIPRGREVVIKITL